MTDEQRQRQFIEAAARDEAVHGDADCTTGKVEAKPGRCESSGSAEMHYWPEEADAEGDTCECGKWYRFRDRIEATP